MRNSIHMNPARRQAFLYLLLICFATATGFSSCVNKKMPSPPPSQHAYPALSEALKVDLFFDATLSMQGFVLTQESSYYQQTIPLLERGVIEGWKGGEPSFFKFGDDIAPLPGRTYLDAAKPAFYTDSKYNKRTFIERVIDRAELNHLTIVITDLFQDNADVNQLSDKLKQKFISNDLAVGVLAVRSQFQGTVYDVGTDNYSFGYRSRENHDSGRPFYLLAFGSHADMDHYFKTLENAGLKTFPEQHTLIFSRFLTTQPSPFTSTKLQTADRISEINATNVLATNYRSGLVKAFKITKGQSRAKFGIEWPYQSLENILQYSSDLSFEIQSWKGEDQSGKELAPIENSEALKALAVTANLFPENLPYAKLHIAADVNVNAFLSGGIYLYRIVLRPSRFSLPDWAAQWNMGDGEIKRWHLHPADFNGAKTYNLESFLGTLQGTVLSSTPPNVGEIYCYIKVEK